MTEHTPGPWEATRHYDGSHWFVEYQLAGVRHTLVDGLSEANAHLIAATPELLKACQDIASIGGAIKKGYHPDKYDLRGAIRIAEDAIAKATSKEV